MASPSDNPLKRLIREIHRRSLWQVLGIFLLGGWVAFEVVQTLTEGLGLPEWFPAFAIVLLIVGLPVVLATAFVQEGGPGRGAGELDVGAPAVPARAASGLFTWRNAILGGVSALTLLIGVGVGWIFFGGGLSTGPAPTSIEQSVVVLPFVNMSGDPDNEYFSDGITEELLNALAQIPDLRVPGRTSSFAFKGQNLTIQQIADTLNVAHVLEGSVRRDGDRVLITAQLVDAQTDTHLWSATFERELTDIFAIQRDIARAIVDQLQVTLGADEEATLVTEATESIEAHEAYLRGRFFWNQRTESGLRTAITEFQRAVDLDSNYAEAYSGLADSYLLVDAYVLTLGRIDYRTNLDRGLIAAERAVQLDPDLGMAHASLGFGLWNVGEWESAEGEFERAIQLNPGYATAHYWYGFSLSHIGKALEGVIHTERAFELDPVSQVNSLILGIGLRLAGRTEEAIEQLHKTTGFAPDWAAGWRELGKMLVESGEYEEGLEALVNSARLGNLDVQAARDAYEAAIRYRQTGEPQTFSDFESSALRLIWLYSQTGQPDRAIELFDDYYVGQGAYGRAAQAHVQFISDIARDDPRYQALLEQAGITW